MTFDHRKLTSNDSHYPLFEMAARARVDTAAAGRFINAAIPRSQRLNTPTPGSPLRPSNTNESTTPNATLSKQSATQGQSRRTADESTVGKSSRFKHAATRTDIEDLS